MSCTAVEQFLVLPETVDHVLYYSRSCTTVGHVLYYSRSCITVVRFLVFLQTVGQSHSPGPQLAEVPLGLESVCRETGEHGAGEEERLQHDLILIEAHCRGSETGFSGHPQFS